MKHEDGGPSVRGHERHECCLPASLRTSDPHDKQVALTTAGAEASQRTALVNFSGGGLGMRTPVYYPRGCELVATVRGLPGGRECRCAVTVRRVWMIECGPEYYLGTSFDDSAEAMAVLSELAAASTQAGHGGGDAR